MKGLSITALVAILLLFGTPLLSIKDEHKTMEPSEIGYIMLDNVNAYIGVLDTTSKAANNTINFISDTLKTINNYLSAIADFFKEIFENDTGQECTGDYENGFTCGTSEGGGGGAIGGGHR